MFEWFWYSCFLVIVVPLMLWIKPTNYTFDNALYQLQWSHFSFVVQTSIRNPIPWTVFHILLWPRDNFSYKSKYHKWKKINMCTDIEKIAACRLWKWNIDFQQFTYKQFELVLYGISSKRLVIISFFSLFETYQTDWCVL